MKSSTGLNENIAGLLTYLFGWVSGLVFFFIEKESQFVRFHAMQSLITFAVLVIVSVVAGFIPVIGGILRLAVGVLSLVLWIILMMKAFKGETFKLPFVGEIAQKKIGN